MGSPTFRWQETSLAYVEFWRGLLSVKRKSGSFNAKRAEDCCGEEGENQSRGRVEASTVCFLKGDGINGVIGELYFQLDKEDWVFSSSASALLCRSKPVRALGTL